MTSKRTGLTANEGKEKQRALGARLHALRRAHNLSRREVATAAGVSPSFLGMVERGETDVSLARFGRIADYFGVSAGELLSKEGGTLPPEITPFSATETVDRGEGVEYRILRLRHPQLVAVTLEAGARFADVRSHRGEDIWIVLEGRPTFIVGDQRHTVGANHVVTFSGTLEHGVANESDARVSLMAICSVPYW